MRKNIACLKNAWRQQSRSSKTKRIVFGSAAAAGMIAAVDNYLNPSYSLEDIKKMQEKELCLIGYNGNLYDVTRFIEEHPGGPQFIKKANGRAIDTLWQNPLFKFHLNSEAVEKLLSEMKIGALKDALPQLDIAEIKKISSGKNDNDMYIHDELNKEPVMLVVDEDGKTETFFVRDHSLDYPDNPVLTIGLDDKKIVLTNELLKKFNAKEFQVPIVCAGAGRSTFAKKTNGTQWGLYGDAIGCQQLKVILLKDILQQLLPEVLQKKDYVIKLVGSDGYFCAIDAEMLHSTVNPVGVSIEQADGDSLPEEHGGERRFVRIGSPGFMHIKELQRIEIQESPSALEINAELMQRHNDPLNHLPERVRKLLAVCSKYDPYLVRSPDGKKIIDFRFELPVSTKIYDVSRDTKDMSFMTLKCVSFSGKENIEKVCISVNGNKEQEIAMPSNCKFIPWEYKYKSASAGDDKVNIKAWAATKSFSQPDAIDHNPRGLFGLHLKAKFNYKEEVRGEACHQSSLGHA